jgi:DNA-binding NtrC family response regulator
MASPQPFADDIRALRLGMPIPGAGSERERIARLADRASRSALPVLIEGEPGSGAQALARAIHDSGERKLRPFVGFHADASPQRDKDPDGAFARSLKDANGGTLFIRHVGGLSGEDQLRLLEALHNPRRQDVRIIAAGFDLAGQVREGRFHEDLYYRLQALPMTLRPLRAQRDAIAEWAGLFMSRFAGDEGKTIRGLSPDAAALLARYDWPGNLRQLENAVYRAVVLAEGSYLTPAEFPQIAAQIQGHRIEIPPAPAARALAPADEHSLPVRPDPHALLLISDNGEMRTLAELEAQAIRFALVHYQGHMSAISRHLGIGRSTLYRKLKELGLDDAAA